MRKKISKSVKEEVYRRFNGRCAYCGWPVLFNEMEIDHSTPISRSLNEDSDDYINSIYNLRLTCHECNNFKSNMSAGEFKLYLENKLMEDLCKDPKYKMAVKYGFVNQLHVKKDIEFYMTDKMEEIFPED